MSKVFIITGEYSGNMHAASVVKALKASNPDINIEGIGADAMSKEGVKLYSDHSKMSAVGLSLPMIVEHIQLGKRVVDYILNDYKPDVVLLVDYGGFNMKIAKFLKQGGFSGKIFYYIPPQIWASRKYRIKSVKKYIDKVLCIFPFEEEMYKEYGIDVHYCGHPLVSQLPEKADRDEFMLSNELNPQKPLLSVFPGSRRFELKFLMKMFLQAARTLKKKHPDLQICFSQAPNLSDDLYKQFYKDGEFPVIKGNNQALLSVSDALILASGTVSLEAALYQTPQLISYRGPWFFYMVYLLVREMDMVSLPNIISGEFIISELIQKFATHDEVVFEAERLLYDKKYSQNQREKLSKVREMLSARVAYSEVAEEILKALPSG